MRFEGRLSDWNAGKACGEITPDQGGVPVWVSQAAFPSDGQLPTLGEALSFELAVGPGGRKQAVQVRRLARKEADPVLRTLSAGPAARQARAARRGRWRLVAIFAVVLLGAVFVGVWMVGGIGARSTNAIKASKTPTPAPAPAPVKR